MGVGSGVGVSVGVTVGVAVGVSVGVFVGSGATVGSVVDVGLGTVLTDGVGLGSSEHPTRSMAKSATPTTSRLMMDFDISALLLVRDEAPTIAARLALPMTRCKVRLYLVEGVLLYPSDKVRSNLAAVVEWRTLIALVEA